MLLGISGSGVLLPSKLEGARLVAPPWVWIPMENQIGRDPTFKKILLGGYIYSLRVKNKKNKQDTSRASCPFPRGEYFFPKDLMGRWRAGMRHAWLGCSSKQFCFQSSKRGPVARRQCAGLEKEGIRGEMCAWRALALLGSVPAVLVVLPIFSFQQEARRWVVCNQKPRQNPASARASPASCPLYLF